jgi:ubiquinone biosynthesis protein UbiJ
VKAELTVSVDASNPALAVAQALTGERPKVEVAGDAAFAADLNWLVDNLRWDYEDDLARVVGAAPARELARLASGAANGLRELVRAVGARGAARRPGTDGPESARS